MEGLGERGTIRGTTVLGVSTETKLSQALGTALGKEDPERQVFFFRVAHRAEAYSQLAQGVRSRDGKEGFLGETFNWVQPDTSLALASTPGVDPQSVPCSAA